MALWPQLRPPFPWLSTFQPHWPSGLLPPETAPVLGRAVPAVWRLSADFYKAAFFSLFTFQLRCHLLTDTFQSDELTQIPPVTVTLHPTILLIFFTALVGTQMVLFSLFSCLLSTSPHWIRGQDSGAWYSIGVRKETNWNIKIMQLA